MGEHGEGDHVLASLADHFHLSHGFQHFSARYPGKIFNICFVLQTTRLLIKPEISFVKPLTPFTTEIHGDGVIMQQMTVMKHGDDCKTLAKKLS